MQEFAKNSQGKQPPSVILPNIRVHGYVNCAPPSACLKPIRIFKFPGRKVKQERGTEREGHSFRRKKSTLHFLVSKIYGRECTCKFKARFVGGCKVRRGKVPVACASLYILHRVDILEEFQGV